jgi:HSP20 family protein
MTSQAEGKELTKAEGRAPLASRPSRGLVSLDDMERMFDRMFEDFWPKRWMRPFGFQGPGRGELAALEGRTPSVDIIDRDNEIIVKAELPGVDKKDLDVSMSDNAATIKATSYKEAQEEKGDYYRSEIAQGSYMRTVALPAEVDGAKCKATFKNGVLELVIPKLEPAQRHRINVE